MATNKRTLNNRKKKSPAVVESWEDELLSSDDENITKDVQPSVGKGESDPDSESESSATKHAKANEEDEKLSDLLASHSPFYSGNTLLDSSNSNKRPERLDKRPEKTVATANRMIGAALGLRLRPTEEQRRFQKSQIENEKKRKEKEKAKQLQDEKAKTSIWDD